MYQNRCLLIKTSQVRKLVAYCSRTDKMGDYVTIQSTMYEQVRTVCRYVCKYVYSMYQPVVSDRQPVLNTIVLI